MKIAPLSACIALFAARSLAISATSATPTAAAPSCTASLITSLCDYPKAGPDFSVAIESSADCVDYCGDHPPCSFVIFAAGNPYTGTGSCLLYPGESFDASKGSSDCGNPTLSVYDQPVCAGGSATTSGACAATATPSAIASVCGYPTPPGDCFDSCSASSGASDCLSQCAEADSCTYVVFNPHNPSNSPYSSGSCWMYPNGTFDAGSATTCSGDPEQFVYNNPCPKPSPSSTASDSPSSSATEASSGAQTAGTTPGSGTSPALGSTARPDMGTNTGSKNSALVGWVLTYPLAIGAAILLR